MSGACADTCSRSFQKVGHSAEPGSTIWRLAPSFFLDLVCRSHSADLPTRKMSTHFEDLAAAARKAVRRARASLVQAEQARLRFCDIEEQSRSILAGTAHPSGRNDDAANLPDG
jgi:hypothetical protein